MGLADAALDERETDRLLDDLDEVQECLVVPTLRSVDERPRVEATLNVIDDAQRNLLGLKPATISAWHITPLGSSPATVTQT